MARIHGLAVDPAGLSIWPGMMSSRVNEYTELGNGIGWSVCSSVPWLTLKMLLGISILQWRKRNVGIGN
jgi:hypothetical protein